MYSSFSLFFCFREEDVTRQFKKIYDYKDE